MALLFRGLAFKSAHMDLSLQGVCKVTRCERQVIISVDEIANNRSWQNVSGSLSLELWALPKPYRGEDFSGQCMAAVPVVQINGQHCLRRCRYETDLMSDFTSDHHIYLMLREWSGDSGFVTQDYVALVIESPLRSNDEYLQPLMSAPADRLSEQSDIIADKDSTTCQIGEPESSVPEQSATPEESREPSVSINQASKSELRSIKGINKKLAKAIIAGRPYKKKKSLLKLPLLSKKKFKRIKRKIRK